MKFIKAGMCPVLFAAALLSGLSAARAQGYYFDLHVGYNMVDSGDLESDFGTASARYEQRPAFGGSFGYMGQGNFRIEGELTHRNNDINFIDGVNVKGNLASLGLMVNMLYELSIGSGSGSGYSSGSASPLRPYIGLGGGGARFTIEATDDLTLPNLVQDISYGVVYQGILGVGVEVTKAATVTLDFRYVVAENVKFSDELGTAFEVDSIQATAMFGLRTTF